MKTAIVIPTLNAVKRGLWSQVLEAVERQTMSLEQKIVIDSASDDQTCSVAESYGWKCWKIARKDFNHGLTRAWAIRELAKTGIDTVFFLSQDVVLETPDSLRLLTIFLWNHPIAGCYGKQRSLHEHTLNAWQRKRCYPEKSTVKNLDNVPQTGLMTIFFSNAFSAWKTTEIIRYGSFRETDFGEDMLFAADILKQGGAIGYCSEASVIHEHSNTPLSLFIRGVQIGNFHRKHPELLQQFGKTGFNFPTQIPWRLLFPLGIKSCGYLCGRMEEKIIPWGFFLLMWLLLFPAILLYDFPQRDVAARYAPMAEAFAEGNWQYAFHPRVTPLLPVCAGMISFLFSCNGYLATQFAASILLTFGIFPLYSGCKKIYRERIAAVTCILYAVCSPCLRLGYYGLRETGGVFGITLLFYAAAVLRKEHRNLQGYCWFGVAEAVLLLNRGDLASFAMIAGVMLFVWDTFRNHIPWRSIVAGILMFGMIAPQLLYNYRMIGYPVPEFRHAVVLRKICHQIPVLKCLENSHPVMNIDIAEGNSHE